MMREIILLLCICCFFASCQQADRHIFAPVGPQSLIQSPSHLCLDWNNVFENEAYYESPGDDWHVLMADVPIFWSSQHQGLILQYKDEDYLFPQIGEGKSPRLTPNYLVYPSEDMHSMIIYKFDTGSIDILDINERIVSIQGIGELYVVTEDDDDDGLIDGDNSNRLNTFRIYNLDFDVGLQLLGEVQTEEYLSYVYWTDYSSSFAFICDKELYLCFGTRMRLLTDMDVIRAVGPSPPNYYRIDAYDENSGLILVRHTDDYYLLKFDENNVSLIDEWDDFTIFNTADGFSFYNGSPAICVDGKILIRNSEERAFEEIVSLPEHLATYSSETPYTEFPPNLVWHMIDGCNGTIILVTNNSFLKFSEADDTFEVYSFRNSTDNTGRFLAGFDDGLILSYELGKYFIFRQ